MPALWIVARGCSSRGPGEGSKMDRGFKSETVVVSLLGTLSTAVCCTWLAASVERARSSF